MLVVVIGREVAHGLCLLDPGVPDDGVLEVVAHNIEAGLAVLDDGGGVLRDVGILDFLVSVAFVLLYRVSLPLGQPLR